MKYIKEFLIIIAVSFVGEICSFLIPLPIPASIYGIVIMFAGLCTKIIPYEAVKNVSHFLVEIMPLMFVPATVGLMDSWGLIKASWIQYLVVTVVSTIVVMVVSGLVTQFFARKEDAEND